MKKEYRTDLPSYQTRTIKRKVKNYRFKVTTENKKIFWQFIIDTNWANSNNYVRTSAYFQTKTKEEQMIIIALFEYYMEELNILCDTKSTEIHWVFVRSMVIGLGEKFYKTITKERIETMQEDRDYTESFSYTFLSK